MHVGIAHHLGWAVLVTASEDFQVADRRRVELIGPDLPAAPIHHRGGAHKMHATGEPLNDDALEALVAQVRSSALAQTKSALDDLAAHVGPVRSISLRDWPDDFPTDTAEQRRAPFESQADSVMYRQVFAELAADRQWVVHRFNASTVESDAVEILGERAEHVLHGPRKVLGPPWNKDHRAALAAIVVAVTQ